MDFYIYEAVFYHHKRSSSGVELETVTSPVPTKLSVAGLIPTWDDCKWFTICSPEAGFSLCPLLIFVKSCVTKIFLLKELSFKKNKNIF